MRLRTLFVAAAVVTASLSAHADAIRFETIYPDNNYIYGLYVTNYDEFKPGNTITLTGLSGVLSVHAYYYNFAASWTPTTVTITATGTTGFYGQSEFTDLFTITTAPGEALGQAAYAVNLAYAPYSSTTFGGTVLGPVAATPEPSSIAFFGTGLLGIAGVVRKRFV